MIKVPRRLLLVLALSGFTLLTGCDFLNQIFNPPPANAPVLGTPTPNPLNLTAFVNASTSGNISFKNTGNADLTYNVSASASYLSTSKSSGTVTAGATESVAVQATCGSTVEMKSASVTITSNAPQNGTQAVTVKLDCQAAPPSSFDVEVRFQGSGFTASRQQAFTNAAARWGQIITGDLAAQAVNKPANACGAGEPAINETVDDLLITAIIEAIDGPGGILGQAGPCLVRPGTGGLPAYGTMRFDSADVAKLESDGSFPFVILHEMGHVLGIGTLWESFGLLTFTTNPSGLQCRNAAAFSVPPSFTGAQAKSAFAGLGGSGNVPVEDAGGAGTQCGHWDEEFFDNELMTGFLDSGSNRLSTLTAGSLADVGYTVNMAAVDSYSIPSCSPSCLRAQGSGLDLGAGEVLLTPIGRVTESGGIILLEPQGR